MEGNRRMSHRGGITLSQEGCTCNRRNLLLSLLPVHTHRHLCFSGFTPGRQHTPVEVWNNWVTTWVTDNICVWSGRWFSVWRRLTQKTELFKCWFTKSKTSSGVNISILIHLNSPCGRKTNIRRSKSSWNKKSLMSQCGCHITIHMWDCMNEWEIHWDLKENICKFFRLSS